MKVVESWLREWVDPALDTAALGQRLTMLGHEVDSIDVDGAGLDGVIVAEVVAVAKHPDADKLSLCQVNDGSGELVDVVCGAPNVVVGMKTPFARPGIRLPNGMKLRKEKIRGVVSNGMLCSAVELGLGEESDGIVSLPAAAQAGESLQSILHLPDAVIDLDLTPNRGDCFSVIGIARDVAALTGASLQMPKVTVRAPTIDAEQPVELNEPEGCPRFAGRIIRGIDPNAESPLWMTERLRRAGLRGISPVVDITNYVMLELGQPLHAYDHALVSGTIRPRMAKAGESVVLLDERQVELQPDTMVVTDDSGVIGMAGIMGGLSTAVTSSTNDVYFEAAFWPQDIIAGRARSYGMHTDASLRFERGVDPAGQARAVERATELLLEIAGGHAGPMNDVQVAEHLPARKEIRLRRARLQHLLGTTLEDAIVEKILTGLQMSVAITEGGWQVTPPSYRFDIAIEADLIEEVARIHGYDTIPEATAFAQSPLRPVGEETVDLDSAAALLAGRDYQEVITYSFIDAESDERFSGAKSELALANPISSEMAVMRSSLWPGLAATAAANSARQQERIRIFEMSKSYHGSLHAHTEVLRIAGLASGPRMPEQWGTSAVNVDFFDIKADVEALFELSCGSDEIEFRASSHPALQPGQSAEIVRGDAVVGVLGKLHPSIAQRYDLKLSTCLFELDAQQTLQTTVPAAAAISRFPAIRRDLAVVIDETVTAGELIRCVADVSRELIRDVRPFDIYRGKGIEAGRKSIAIGLILQETSRTLTDDDADSVLSDVIKKLQDQFGAELRD